MTIIQTTRARVLVGLAFAAAGDVLESTPELIEAHVKAGDVDADAAAVEFALSENARVVRHGLPDEQAIGERTANGTGEPAAAEQQIDQVERAAANPVKRTRAAAPTAAAEAQVPATGGAQAETEPATAEASAAADSQPAASA